MAYFHFFIIERQMSWWEKTHVANFLYILPYMKNAITFWLWQFRHMGIFLGVGMNIWEYEGMNIWEYEGTNVCGYEDMRTLSSSPKTSIRSSSSSSEDPLFEPRIFPFHARISSSWTKGIWVEILLSVILISLAISSLRGSRCFFNNSQLILIICLKFCTFRSYLSYHTILSPSLFR